MVTTYLHRTII